MKSSLVEGTLRTRLASEAPTPTPPPPRNTQHAHTRPSHTPRPSHACAYLTCSPGPGPAGISTPAALLRLASAPIYQAGADSRAQKLLPGARLLGNLQLGGHSPHFQGPAGLGLPHPRACGAQGRCLGICSLRGQTWPSFVRRRGGGGRTEEWEETGKK